MKRYSLFLLVLLFPFFLACGDKDRWDGGGGKAQIVTLYEEGQNTNNHTWRTTIQCVRDQKRFILRGRVGNVGDIYASSKCAKETEDFLNE